MPEAPTTVAGEAALLVVGVVELLGGEARWRERDVERARAMPFAWRAAIKQIVRGEVVDRPDIPKRPKVIPAEVLPPPGSPPELGAALEVVLRILTPLDDVMSSESPMGPIPRPHTLGETWRRNLLWATVADPVSVLADASRGGLSYAQIDIMKDAYPGILATWQTLIESEITTWTPGTVLPASRAAVSMIMARKAASEPPKPAPMAAPEEAKPYKAPKPGENESSTQSQNVEGR